MVCYSIKTDIGIKKKVNQDAVLVKEAKTSKGKIYMFVICDGMGGLSHGEVASGKAIRAFDKWFSSKLGVLLANKSKHEVIIESWKLLIESVSNEIMRYGEENGVQLGTTLTATLVFEDLQYVFAHVGDTRLYHFSDDTRIVTEDHTVIAREIRLGNITPEEALTDPRRNMLLQAVGASEILEIQTGVGIVKAGEYFLLCSDGFRHKINEKEIRDRLVNCTNKNDLDEMLTELIELNKQRQETDNITAILVRF